MSDKSNPIKTDDAARVQAHEAKGGGVEAGGFAARAQVRLRALHIARPYVSACMPARSAYVCVLLLHLIT